MSPVRMRSARFAALALLTVAALLVPASAFAAQPREFNAPAQATSCNPGDYPGGVFPNEIVAENCLPGASASIWDVTGAGDLTIQGFATDISVAQGETVNFKIQTPSTDYKLDIYRMGYYGGAGARFIATVQPSATLPQTQPACLADGATQLIDCGNWAVSASWAAPANAVSGIYFARLAREDVASAGSHIVFIVRDDDGDSNVLFQTSDTTWQAYNNYGGHSLYYPSQESRAYKVSYNRPFNTRSVDNGQDFVFHAEYPMVRWLESNGYDVSYFTGVDADRRGSEVLEHNLYLSVGHDEYWSAGQRTNVTAARDAGVNLAFFSGNEVFWKTRWENSTDGSNTPFRTLVSYKETHAGAKIDPLTDVWTGTWRDVRTFNPEGPQPENALTGQIFTVNSGSATLRVPWAEGQLRLWRNTAAAALAPGGALQSTANLVGYEWDEPLDNGARPAGLFNLSEHVVNGIEYLQDNGSTFAPGTATHRISLYSHGSGANRALVFGAGTVQWSWGLDGNHDNGSTPADLFIQQATVNLFADMGVQPATLQSGLVAASASADATAPTAHISAPANAATVSGLTTISGSANDSGGGKVGGVEVSVDGGTTWHAATGRESWSYAWTPAAPGPATILSRAVDDSGNLGAASSGVNVTVAARTCPCSIWEGTGTPVTPNDLDGSAIEVGVKFQTDVAGWITGLRFYKGSLNTGTNVGHLWDAAGNPLAAATFVGESESGWQEVTLAQPVPVNANTTYVASYHSSSGRYASTTGGLSSAVVNAPVRALADGVAGGNGVYHEGSSAFPVQTYDSSNYWVDVVFATTVGPDTTAPSVHSVSPAANATGVPAAANVSAVFDEALNAASVTAANVELRDSSNVLVDAAINYQAAARRIVIDPVGALAYNGVYTARLKGGSGGIADLAGNFLATDYVWSFTVAAPPGPGPETGPGGPILVIAEPANPFTRFYAEILRSEGLNAFAVADIGTVNLGVLANYQVVILGEMALSPAQAAMLSDWVNTGGNLIAMRPDSDLYALLGISAAGGAPLAEGYFLVNTTAAPGMGIVAQTMQYHGAADRYTLNGAAAVATLYSDVATATASPAVTLRSLGGSESPDGGQAAAFAFDLARSIVYTRQGNPAWEGQERDGVTPIRPDDLFFGAAAGDVQPDWVNLAKVAIPQADEAQRLLANLILNMNADRMPLPRFWYFPRGEKAVVVMTHDNHGGGDTLARLNSYNAASPANCSLDNWECVRSTTYPFADVALTDAQLAAFQAQGHEFAVHVDTGCADFTPESLALNYTNDIGALAAAFPSVAAPKTQRTHCIAFSDWAGQPMTELQNGIRLDTNYYFWPPEWVNDTPGLFTGSAMPMRFADVDGTMIDVYQATTQMTDESDQSYPFTINTLLDRALGPEGYYGAFVSNQHTDSGSTSSGNAAAIVASAQARSVPIISAAQLLAWTDGRNASSFANLNFTANTLSFDVNVGAGANGLTAMLPMEHGTHSLGTLTRGGVAVPYTQATVKGVTYAQFSAAPGTYAASYALDTTAPTVTSVAPSDGATGVAANATVAATFSEPMNAATLTTASFELRDAANALVAASVAWNGSTNTATLTPAAPLAQGVQYTARVGTTVTDVAGNALATARVWSFTVAGPAYTCPCSIWGNTGGTPGFNDPAPYDLGVRFKSVTAGYITGIRFYRGETGGGPYVGKLWSNGGALLGSATLNTVTTPGWQEVLFATPVAISAETPYVASYYTPQGAYSATPNSFGADVVNGPLTAFATGGPNGPNGVFSEGGGFPTSSFNNANYWVDVLFDLNAATDTTPPTVIQRTPAPGATGVAVATPVTVQFSEPMDAATIGATTITLRAAGAGADVAAAVTWNATTQTATLTPAAALAFSTQYTARVVGGAGGVKDVAGNALATDDTWTFTTVADTPPPVCPCSIWDTGFTPQFVPVNDGQPIEVGTKFRSSAGGQITALRYYKGAGDSDTHVGHLWSSAGGAPLATVTFTGESASGWQEMALPTPITILPNTTYIASIFSSPVGYFANTPGGLATARDNPPLRALAAGEDGPNGVYKYGGGFPDGDSNANYWVDVVFSLPDSVPPTIIQRTPAPDATDVAVGTNVSVQFSEAMAPLTLNTSTITLRADGASVDVAANVTYNSAAHTAVLDPTADLLPATLYRVTVAAAVADVSNNLLGAADTWSFTTAAPPPVPDDDTLADFAAGTPGACYLAQRENGEVILAPQLGEEFSSATIPAGWESVAWTGGGGSTFSGTAATVDGARLGTTGAYYAPGRSLEFVATFGAEAFQHVGFGQSLENEIGEYWAMFSTRNTADALWARTNVNGVTSNIEIPGTWLGSPHRFRIDWGATAVVFSIDGTVVYTESINVPAANMRPVVSNYAVGGPALAVDWLHMSPYATPCTFTSRVLDAGSTVDWLALSSTGARPAGTSVAFETRVGGSATPDGGWSAWAAVGTGGAVAGPDARYIQYRATLETTAPGVTPEVASVAISRGAPANRPPVANPVSITTPEDTAVSVTLNATDLDGNPLTYSHTDPAHGVLSGTGAGRTYTPTPNYNGPDSFTFKVNDGTVDSNVATVSITVTPVNDAPVLAEIVNQSSAEGDVIALALSASDIDGGALAFSATGLPPGLNINATTGAIGGTITYAAAANSPYAVTVTVDDGAGGSAARSFTWTVANVNRAPVLGAIGGQSGSEGTPIAFTAAASDPDGDALTFSLVGAPTGASINPASGAFTWTPTEAQGPGSYTFTVKVTDTGNPALTDEEEITVTVSEVNVAPVLAAIGNKAVAEGVQLVFTANATDADLPANTLTFSLVGAPTGASINPASGAFTWTPTEAQGPGEYTFTVKVTDNGTPALTDEEEITVTVSEVNVAPVLAAIGNKAVAEGVQLVFTANATDADLPANTLTFSLVGAPIGASIDPASGAFTWTPTEAQGPGSYTFSVKVTDNGTPALTDEEEITVTVSEVNSAPVANPASITTPEDVAAAVTLDAADPDDNPLTYTIVTPPTHGVLSGTGAGLTYTPSPNYNGPDSFTYKANDGTVDSNVATVTITVTPVNDAPTLDSIPDQSTAEGVTVSLATSGHDVDGDTLAYSATGLPPALVINPTTGVIAGKVSYAAADGSPWSVTVTVNDGKGGTAARTFSWAITDVPTPRFALSSAGGAHGAQIVMPLTYAEATALEGLRFSVIYDPAVVTPVQVVAAGQGAGWSLASNLANSGIFTVSMTSATPLNGSGTLANITFALTGAPGAATPLTLSNLEANAVPVPPDRLTHGAASVALVRMAGTVAFWNGGAPVAGTTLNLVTGGAPRTAGNAADGSFAFENLAGGAWTLTPVKSDDVRGIGALDASLILRSRVGTVTLSPGAALAADIDESGAVDELDASAILRVSTEDQTLPVTPNGSVWRFMPAVRSDSALLADALGQDFAAVLLGDVSGSWTATAAAADTSNPAAALAVDLRAAADGAQELVFTLTPTGAPVYSVDLRLRYDDRQIELLGAQAAQTPGQMAATGLREPGIVRVALASSTPLPAGTEVAIVRVRSAGDLRAGLLEIRAAADERPVQVNAWAPSDFRIFLPVLGR